MATRMRHRDKISIRMRQAENFAGYERCNSCFAGVLYGS